MSDVVSRLEQFRSPTPSRWREKAEWRRANKEWLRYSQFVAMKMLDQMDAEHISQSQLVWAVASSMFQRF